MLEQFLHYSLAHGRPIRVITLTDSGMKALTITVLSVEDTHISCRIGRRAKPVNLDLAAILSAAYARGDDGSLTEGTPSE